MRRLTGGRAIPKVIGAACILIAACADNRITEPEIQLPTQGGVTCELGCLDIDPYPNAPGIFLGSGITPANCNDGEYTDADQDGLGDFCEEKLAAAFAPELYYYSADIVGREPHWVAQSVDDRVSIGYLLSYYYDNGSHAGWACAVPAPWWTQGCYPHNGDSEAIFLHVEFNEATSHWVLAVAFYSQHEGYGVYGRGTNAYPTALFYPGALGGHPRAYVAQGKHANYSTISECNSGGALGTDVCYDVNAGARVAAASFLNLGSRANHTSAQDCMPSSNPSYQYYGSGRLECYWTNQPFRGWIPLSVGGEDSDGYSDRLADMGF